MDNAVEPLGAGQQPVDEEQTAELTDRVGLTTELLGRRPHEVSDGTAPHQHLDEVAHLQYWIAALVGTDSP